MENKSNSQIVESMKLSLSGDQVQKLIPFKVRVFTYPEIKNFHHVDQLLDPYGAVVILFNTSEGKEGQAIGHWCGICRTLDDDHNPSINFFDSYSMIPDDEKKYINKNFLEEKGMKENFLLGLLYDAQQRLDDVIEYNDMRMQKMSPNIRTCGRFTALRLTMKDKSMNKFQKFIKRLQEKFSKSPDEIVTLLTQPVLDGEMTSQQLRNILEELYNEK